MAYTKPDQTPFAANLDPDEFVVQLDTGDLVAVRADSMVEPNTGNTVIHAHARAVNADGSSRTDATGAPIPSAYSFSADAATVEALGGMGEFQRKMLLTVLGEPQSVIGWLNPPQQDVLDHASIRTTLAAAAHAGPVILTNIL